MQTLLDKMLFELQLRTYAKTTQKHYISHMKRFLKACNNSPSTNTLRCDWWWIIYGW